MNDSIKLTKYKFIEVGEWKIKAGKLSFNLKKYDEERVIYAFVVNDNVKYIGVCREYSRTLKKRMDNYKLVSEGSGSTNKNIHKEIINCLSKKETVKIWALKPDNPPKYMNLIVDLINGLEIPLIKVFNPGWNKIGGRKVVQVFNHDFHSHNFKENINED